MAKVTHQANVEVPISVEFESPQFVEKKKGWKKRTIWIIAASVLALAFLVFVLFFTKSTPPPPVTPPPAPVVASLPRCSDKIAECEAMAAMLGEAPTACAKIDTECQ